MPGKRDTLKVEGERLQNYIPNDNIGVFYKNSNFKVYLCQHRQNFALKLRVLCSQGVTHKDVQCVILTMQKPPGMGYDLFSLMEIDTGRTHDRVCVLQMDQLDSSCKVSALTLCVNPVVHW